GVAGDTYHTHEALASAGHDEVLRLGDRDRATHILRSEYIRQGASLTEAVGRTARMLGAQVAILPMCDEPVSSIITTDDGTMHFQDFWVGKRGRPEVMGIEYLGIENTTVSDAVRKAVEQEDTILIGPSNPITSIGPILAVKGMRELIRNKHVVAVSPIIGCEPVSGPAGKLMSACGCEVSSRGVARFYEDLLDVFVVDERDGVGLRDVEGMGVAVVSADTMMTSAGKSKGLAEVVMSEMI
ncbi:MAG: 2-phospho-L-lactate transferase, partial [ANME-2 cluster archaeon]|nr:2-phospho-L-lactate transferase [ANME-2 cluster archaeon]